MNNWKPSYYREDSRLDLPFPLTIPAFTVKYVLARNDADRQVLKERYISNRHTAEIRRETMAGDPWNEPDFKLKPEDRAFLYDSHVLGLSQIALSILHEMTYDLKHHANVLFAEEMAERMKEDALDQRYDAFLVWGVRVRNYDLDPVTYREDIWARARVDVETTVMDELATGWADAGVQESATIAYHIKRLMTEPDLIS